MYIFGVGFVIVDVHAGSDVRVSKIPTNMSVCECKCECECNGFAQDGTSKRIESGSGLGECTSA